MQKRQNTELKQLQMKGKESHSEDFVLEKTIFSNIFEKDIRRVFIYKKAERLAKAIHLIAPAFSESVSLKNRMSTIAIGLIDAAVLPSGAIRMMLSREILALSSMLSMARTSGLLSTMNAELITHEAHTLLQEVAEYEEPRLSLDDIPTLSVIAKNTLARESTQRHSDNTAHASSKVEEVSTIKDISDKNSKIKDRRETILSVIKNKQKANIKDISTLIRGVSEKTIQRELSALIDAGMVVKEGERRWSTYSLA